MRFFTQFKWYRKLLGGTWYLIWKEDRNFHEFGHQIHVKVYYWTRKKPIKLFKIITIESY